MSARLQINFQLGDIPLASVYHHTGGEFVRDIEATMNQFIDALKDLPDNRWGDASYLAAKYVVWAAWGGQDADSRLDFLGVGVTTPELGEQMTDATVVIDCSQAFGTYRIVRAIDVEIAREVYRV